MIRGTRRANTNDTSSQNTFVCTDQGYALDYMSNNSSKREVIRSHLQNKYFPSKEWENVGGCGNPVKEKLIRRCFFKPSRYMVSTTANFDGSTTPI
mmetsp:Transcript_4863/g.6866  ORF Transcript_4863/g.6866 Transcript_4863/m.6866 type:complete len:96 (+) Transcript_4863:2079-2366(+)